MRKGNDFRDNILTKLEQHEFCGCQLVNESVLMDKFCGLFIAKASS